MAFVFYDAETTGKDTRFDQILQFAAIYTDAELKEVDRFVVRCRALPHVVPSPEALKINKISVHQLANPALPSNYEAVTRIYEKFRTWSPAVFIGFNSIGFDEKLLRHEFYKNLLPAYLTNCHKNCRSDVLQAIIAAALYEPESITIPEGKKAFTLDRLAVANSCSSETAHDALDDTLATLCLARLLHERAPNIWSAFMRFSKKTAVIDYLNDELVVLYSARYFGKSDSWYITRIGESETRDAYQYVFALNCDPDDLSKMSDTRLEKRLTESPKPVRIVKANAAPILMPCDQIPSNIDARDIDLSELVRRAERLQNDKSLCQRLTRNFEATRKKYDPGVYVEQKLYDGFFSDYDKSLMKDFHRAPWTERPAIIKRFTDPRLRELGLRLIHCEHSEILDDKTRAEIDMAIAVRVAGDCANPPFCTLQKAIGEIEECLEIANYRERILLEDYRKNLTKRLDEALATLTSKNR